MKALVTGATGTVGRHLLPLLVEKYSRVFALYRSRPGDNKDVTWLHGDVTYHNLGLPERNYSFDAVYHVAGLVLLNDKYRHQLYLVNDIGTYNVYDFALRNGGAHIYHVSTAYLHDPPWNAYEETKKAAEQYAGMFEEMAKRPWRNCNITTTIFRPSIVITDPANGKVPLQAFPEFIRTIAKVHRRLERVRKAVEGTLRLPPIDASMRIKSGEPGGVLNLITAKDVAKGIASIDDEGVFYLTHPNPPKLQDLAKWVGGAIGVRLEFQQEFSPSSVEALFQRITKSFAPYLNGDEVYPTALADATPISKDLVQRITMVACL